MYEWCLGNDKILALTVSSKRIVENRVFELKKGSIQVKNWTSAASWKNKTTISLSLLLYKFIATNCAHYCWLALMFFRYLQINFIVSMEGMKNRWLVSIRLLPSAFHWAFSNEAKVYARITQGSKNKALTYMHLLYDEPFENSKQRDSDIIPAIVHFFDFIWHLRHTSRTR